MDKLSQLIEHLPVIKDGTKLRKEVIRRLEDLNKRVDEKLSIHFVSKSFYCHNQQVLAGNRRCSEICLSCIEKNMKQ